MRLPNSEAGITRRIAQHSGAMNSVTQGDSDAAAIESTAQLPVLQAASANELVEARDKADLERFEANIEADSALAEAAAEPAPGPAPKDLLQSLQAELQDQSEQLADLESDLQAAEEQIHRLEAELRTRNSRIALLLQQAGLQDAPRKPNGEHAVTQSMPGTTPGVMRLLAEAEASAEPAAANGKRDLAELIRAAQPERDQLAGAANGTRGSVPEGAARFLVMIDGDGDIVHLLGRRTTVGRGPGNDIQLDQSFVSRHHAILIAGPNQTVIEDLRSTNGVLVNGQRVRRCVLNDGDVVLIGKTKLRFAQRRGQAA